MTTLTWTTARGSVVVVTADEATLELTTTVNGVSRDGWVRPSTHPTLGRVLNYGSLIVPVPSHIDAPLCAAHDRVRATERTRRHDADAREAAWQARYNRIANA